MKPVFRKLLQRELSLGFIVSLVVALTTFSLAGPAASVVDKTRTSGTDEEMKEVLDSALAGSWYPADADALRKQLADFFSKADVEPTDNVIAVILPHAGYRYSGQTAAYGLKAVKGKYKRVVVIGPSHHGYMEQVLSVPIVTHYRTPLGLVPVDTGFVEKLLKFKIFQNLPYVHRYEHSVQIEVPLLQFCQKDFKLVPVVAGDCSFETIKKAAGILRSLVDEQTLVVASSDFVHYGPRYGFTPFKENVPEQIKKLDMGAYDYIAKLDGKGFLDYIRKTGATICGRVPIAILLSMLDKDTAVKLIHYDTSGRVTGDFSNSVSYFAIVFTGRWRKQPGPEPVSQGSELTEQDKRRLLELARKSIEYALKYHRVPEPSRLGIEITPAMQVPRAAFVTLKKNTHLRGCIGDIFPQRPLYRSVIANAINAAFNDPRFPPLREDEFGDIKIEISALTAPKPVDSPDKIRIGIDGVVLRKAGRSAVFLPQVAPEQGWNREQTLTHLSLKAGLEPDAWKSGATFLVFQADVFGEE